MINPHNAPLSVFTAVPGWETPMEQGVLMSIASTVQAQQVIVEIGSELGMSASLFHKASPDAFVCCIDIDGNAPYILNLREVDLYSDYYLRSIYADSHEFDWKDWSIQHLYNRADVIRLLFVDGDHSYNGALSDLVRYTPFVVKDGFVLVHDCACNTNKNPHESHYEVYNAVQEWLQRDGSRDDFRFMFSVDSTMVFKRMK